MRDNILLYGSKKQNISGSVPDMLHERISVLDGFRGLAVLLVMCYHYIPSFYFGWVGVDLFFVLSGFLITSILINSITRRRSLAVYLSRRFLRIIPVYFLALLFLFVILPFVWPAIISNSFQELIQHQQWYWFFGINIFHAIHGFPDNITTVHFWSLACEMQFYLIWPLVISVFGKHKKQLLIVLIVFIVISIAFRNVELFMMNPIYRYVLLPSRLDAFCLGAILFLFITSSFVISRQTLYLIAAILFITIILLSIFQIRWHFSESFVQRFGLTINCIFWFAILAISLKYKNSIAAKIGNNRLLRHAGVYSYGMYIFHLPVGILLNKIPFFASPPEETIIMITFLRTITAFLITVLLSTGSYHLFEKQIMLLKPRYNAIEN